MGNDKQQVIKEICAINAVINYHKKNNLSWVVETAMHFKFMICYLFALSKYFGITLSYCRRTGLYNI